MKKRVKFKMKNIGLVLVIFILILSLFFLLFKNKDSKLENKKDEEIITDFKEMELERVKDYASKKKIELDIKYEYNDEVLKDKVIKSSLEENNLSIVVSLGSIPISEYKEKKVNELGHVPIMMYHGIVDTKDNKYTGGNVDKDGYNRTSQAFLSDLEFYYKNGYRMIRLVDYVSDKIDVSLGYSPIILTFDDGNANNFKVVKKNSDGSLEFDPNSAIGILENMKKKYPDFNVTATFFLNSTLCNQPEYNEDIMKWLVENGYDIGNHTTTHANFSSIGIEKTKEVVGKLYQSLEEIIPGKYVSIVALPFGSPYKKSHANYPYILKGEYNGHSYETIAALRVGWEAEVSPFEQSFDRTFLKRCRAYDNNGSEFDIEMNFKLLAKNRYISDGNVDTVVIPKKLETKMKDTNLKVITYEEDV